MSKGGHEGESERAMAPFIQTTDWVAKVDFATPNQFGAQSRKEFFHGAEGAVEILFRSIRNFTPSSTLCMGFRPSNFFDHVRPCLSPRKKMLQRKFSISRLLCENRFTLKIRLSHF